jgi:hypothetical protein
VKRSFRFIWANIAASRFIPVIPVASAVFVAGCYELQNTVSSEFIPDCVRELDCVLHSDEQDQTFLYSNFFSGKRI